MWGVAGLSVSQHHHIRQHGYVRSEAHRKLYGYIQRDPEEQEAPLCHLPDQGWPDRRGEGKGQLARWLLQLPSMIHYAPASYEIIPSFVLTNRSPARLLDADKVSRHLMHRGSKAKLTFFELLSRGKNVLSINMLKFVSIIRTSEEGVL